MQTLQTRTLPTSLPLPPGVRQALKWTGVRLWAAVRLESVGGMLTPKRSNIQSSGKHLRPDTDSSEAASVSSLILQLKKLSASDSSTIIVAVIRNLRKAANPCFLGFYHWSVLPLALIQPCPVLECLLYPKYCLNF